VGYVFRGIDGALRKLRSQISTLRRNGFVRSVAALVGGTVFSQAIILLALPVITRLYSPSDFSILAVYLSLLSMIAVAACLRFDVAIPLPERDDDAANLLVIALLSSLLVSLLTGVLAWLFSGPILIAIGIPQFKPYVPLIPVAVFLFSTASALQFWMIRKKEFGKTARTKILQTTGDVGTQVTLGLAGIGPVGLLTGQMLNSSIAVLRYGIRALRSDAALLKTVNRSDMRRMFREYDRFPKYSTIESLGSIAGLQLPILLIASLAAVTEVGYLNLAMRAMQAPMALIGSAVAQVYVSRAPAEYREGRLGSFTTRMLGGLMKAGVGPLLFAAIIAPVAFPMIFGKQWSRAGELVAWMSPWFIMQFLVSPVSMTLSVTGNQKIAVALQLSGLAIRIIAVGFAAKFMPRYIVELYALSGFAFYTGYFIVVAKIAQIKLRPLAREMRQSIHPPVAWLILALLVRYVTIGPLI
jgi:O-antigen/teichoic acid export membrane protein